MPNIYNAANDCIKEMIKKINSISFTTDNWRDLNKDQFISLTGHCTFNNFDQQALVLHTKPFDVSHTGVNISDMMTEMIDEFDIPKYKIHNIVHDNASNMVCGISENTEYDSLPCFIHTTQLCINDCIMEQKSVSNIISKCRNLASHFSRSIPALHKLQEFQDQLRRPKLRLQTDVVTRWDSKYFMLDRTLEMKMELVLYFSEHQCDYKITQNEWDLMEKLVTLLKAFHDITKKMSEKYANSSEIIPQIKVLKVYVKKTVAKLTGLSTTLAQLEASFDTRYNGYLNNENCILATYLDPKFKHIAFKDEDSHSIRGKDAIEELIIEKYMQYEIKKNSVKMKLERVNLQNFPRKIYILIQKICLDFTLKIRTMRKLI